VFEMKKDGSSESKNNRPWGNNAKKKSPFAKGGC
jgi:hypothetical protein